MPEIDCGMIVFSYSYYFITPSLINTLLLIVTQRGFISDGDSDLGIDKGSGSDCDSVSGHGSDDGRQGSDPCL